MGSGRGDRGRGRALGRRLLGLALVVGGVEKGLGVVGLHNANSVNSG